MGSSVQLPSAVDPDRIDAFCNRVWEEGRQHYRVLPWRHIDDAYAVLVSEVMLQQTQVSRVIRYWKRFLDRFPTIDALASAESGAVLEIWQGLGYNRRALMLKHCAETCSEQWGGELPHAYQDLVSLPGIGPATAAGVRSFAWNKPGVYLETNVRSVFLYEWFPDAQEPVRDKQLIPLIEATCSQDNPRDWYYALLDYGAYLKSTHPNPSRCSAHHTRQSTFEGSRRQKRAEIVRLVLEEPGIVLDDIVERLNELEVSAGRTPVESDVAASIVGDLLKEGFFHEEQGRFRC
ncbi:MAG: adenine glycosylase [Eggerthellaceae bacterium]|jgi:A/G-specific adenine glycosylase